MQRLLLPAARARCTQPLLSKFSTFHLPLPVASQTKERCVQRPCLPTAAALPVSKKWVCTEFASLLVRPTNVPALKQRLPLTAVCSGNRFWRALGPPGDQSGDRLGSVGMRGLTPRGKDAPCAADSLTTCYEMACSLMPLDRDTRRGPRTRVLAVITRRSAHCSLLRTHKPRSPLLLCSARAPLPLAPVPQSIIRLL